MYYVVCKQEPGAGKQSSRKKVNSESGMYQEWRWLAASEVGLPLQQVVVKSVFCHPIVIVVCCKVVGTNER